MPAAVQLDILRISPVEELFMNLSNSCARILLVMALFAAAIAISSAALYGQEDSWQVIRADYGFGNRRTDVTVLIRDLLSRGGVNGRIAVNNQTMGGDPAVGKDKSLRIFARNRNNQDHEFDYGEDGFVPVSIFVVPRDGMRGNDRDGRERDEHHDDRGGLFSERNRDARQNLSIVRGFYGVQGRTVNVTDILKRMVRDGALTVNVSNRSLGGDPAVGADKMLIVVYSSQGKEQATAVAEGTTLTIP
jgi:hypothetical protein